MSTAKESEIRSSREIFQPGQIELGYIRHLNCVDCLLAWLEVGNLTRNVNIK